MEAVAEQEVKRRHIRNYALVKRMINARYRKRIAEAKARIEKYRTEGVPEDWHTTPEQCIAGEEQYLRLPKKKGGKPVKGTFYAWWQADLARLEAADRAGRVREIIFKIEWKRSNTWGMCPSCETWVSYEGPEQDVVKDEHGNPILCCGKPIMVSTHYNPRTYASGCGYDKRSTVMSDGVQCPAIDRLVIENRSCWEKYAIDGRDCLPHMSFGGKGTETFQSLFKAYGEKAPIPGFEIEWAEGQTWDYIHVVRKDTARKRRKCA